MFSGRKFRITLFIAVSLAAALFVTAFLVNSAPKGYSLKRVSSHLMALDLGNLRSKDDSDLKPIASALGLGDYINKEFRPYSHIHVSEVFAVRMFNFGKVTWLYSESNNSSELKDFFVSKVLRSCKVASSGFDEIGLDDLVIRRSPIFLVVTEDREIYPMTFKFDERCKALVWEKLSSVLAKPNFRLTYILKK